MIVKDEAYVLVVKDSDGDYVVKDISLNEDVMYDLGDELCDPESGFDYRDYYVTVTKIEYEIDEE